MLKFLNTKVKGYQAHDYNLISISKPNKLKQLCKRHDYVKGHNLMMRKSMLKSTGESRHKKSLKLMTSELCIVKTSENQRPEEFHKSKT